MLIIAQFFEAGLRSTGAWAGVAGGYRREEWVGVDKKLIRRETRGVERCGHDAPFIL